MSKKIDWIEDHSQPIEECSSDDLKEFALLLAHKMDDIGFSSRDVKRFEWVLFEIGRREVFGHALPADESTAKKMLLKNGFFELDI